MKIIKIFSVVVMALLVFSAYKAEKKTTIFMIGDSTMANKDISGGKLERGWGMMLKNFFTEDIIVDNHAQNGRSSKSFIDEGLWQAVYDKIKPGDYVFIQFGHNDEKKDAARHTAPGSTFDDNLRKFVNETRVKGGIPVLFNSVVRRNFADSKTAVEDDDLRTNSSKGLKEGNTLIDTHGEYAKVPQKIARELGVAYVDANKITHELEQGLGVDGSKKLHMIYQPGEVASLPEGRQDNTHYNVHGASTVASLLVDAVADKVPALKKYVCHYDIVVAKDGSGQYLDLQKAIDEAPEGKKLTLLLCDGEWKKPVMPKGKSIKIVKRSGASWIK